MFSMFLTLYFIFFLLLVFFAILESGLSFLFFRSHFHVEKKSKQNKIIIGYYFCSVTSLENNRVIKLNLIARNLKTNRAIFIKLRLANKLKF